MKDFICTIRMAVAMWLLSRVVDVVPDSEEGRIILDGIADICVDLAAQYEVQEAAKVAKL